MKKIILSRDKGDEGIKRWFNSIGIETLTPDAKMDSWIDGLVIGGGSDPGIPKDAQRDKLELDLIENAVKQRIPILGICRGAEILTIWSRGKLSTLQRHSLSYHMSKWHKVLFTDYWPEREAILWSHHHLTIEKSGTLKPAAFSEDGNIEALIDEKKRILGVLWHPERSADQGVMSILPWIKWIEKRFR